MSADAGTLADRLPGFIGRPGPRRRAADAVNHAMIRHWCEVLGDTNPAYADGPAAARTMHGGTIAPPAMLQAWTMPGFQEPPAADDPVADLYALLDDAGYTGIVATNSEQDYAEELRPGDRVFSVKTIQSISSEKRTGLGRGFFITSRVDYARGDGVPVGRQMHRVLKFAAVASAQQPTANPTRDADAAGPSRYSSQHGSLPPLSVPLTRSFIAASAIASRDYQPVHHDPDMARARGSQDVFMNILTSNGLVGRYATDWAGPDARLMRIAVRLGTQNYPGDTMVLTGSVVAERARPDGREVELAVRATNRLGDHLTGRVSLTLPGREEGSPTGRARPAATTAETESGGTT